MYKAKKTFDLARVSGTAGISSVLVLDDHDSGVRMEGACAAPLVLMLTSVLEAMRGAQVPAARITIGTTGIAVEAAETPNGVEYVAVVFVHGDPVVKSLSRLIRRAWGVTTGAKPAKPRAKRQTEAEILSVLRFAADTKREVEIDWHRKSRVIANLDGGPAKWGRRGVPVERDDEGFELLAKAGPTWWFKVGDPVQGVPGVTGARLVGGQR